MKTPLEVARDEARRACSNAERAREAAARALQWVDPSVPAPSGTMAMAVASAQSAALAATAASEAAAHALSIAESEGSHAVPSSFEQACRAVSKSLHSAVEASHAAVASSGLASILHGSTPASSPASELTTPKEKHCSFCGRSDDAARLVAGPLASICKECVKLCARVLGLE